MFVCGDILDQFIDFARQNPAIFYPSRKDHKDASKITDIRNSIADILHQWEGKTASMARNEEKQLARLNRWYLQKHREEEAIKRPPRPKLNCLNTAEEVKKWIPTITRDIDFYVKQMEVPCYPEHVITDFNRRIDHLKGEYKAFLRKLRELCPEEKSTPWSDRPYSPKRRKVNHQSVEERSGTNISNNSTCKESSDIFIPMRTPVLDNHVEYEGFYGPLKIAASPSQFDLNDEHQNQPLDFLPIPKASQRSNDTESITTSLVSKNNETSVINNFNNNKGTFSDEGIVTRDISESQNSIVSPSSVQALKDSSCFSVQEKSNSNNETLARSSMTTPQSSMPSLNLPYTDSSSDESDEAN